MMALLTGPIVAQPQSDPLEAYLKEKGGGQDELANYLREQQVQAAAKNVGPYEALGAGAAQGATLGFGDEAQGAIQALGIKMAGQTGAEKPFAQLYRENRDVKRLENEAAQQAHSGAYLTGEVAGGVAPTLLAPGGRLWALATGAAQGAGFSNADTPGGLAGDTALGGGLGVAGHDVGTAISSAGARLASLARGKAGQAAARAGQQATEEESAKLASLVGQYGGEMQKGSRYVENLMRLEESMTPAQRVLFEQLKQSGVVPQLQQRVAQSTLESLPGQAASIAARKAEVEAAQQALPQAIAARTAELSKPQIGADLASLAKSYGEPVLAAAVAPPGMKEAAGLIFGRTRAGKAIAMRVNRPGNQIALWEAVQRAGEAPSTDIGEMLKRAIAAATTQQSVQPQ